MNGDVGSSPRVNRQHERDEIKDLNDRFAGYIDTVKNLKGHNVSLEAEIEALKKEINTGADRLKEMYEAELEATRSLLEETEDEKARQAEHAQDVTKRNAELKKRLEELRNSVDGLERNLMSATQKLNTLDGQHNTTSHECMELGKTLRDVEREIEDLKRKIERLKRELETEVEEKKKLQDQIQQLKKELDDAKQEYLQDMEDLNATGQPSFQEGIDSPHFDTTLDDAIEEIRAISERECANHKMEMERRHRDNIDNLEDRTKRNADNIKKLTSDLRKLTDTNTTKIREIKKVQGLVDGLEKQVKDRDEEIARNRQDRNEEVSAHLDELRRLRENYEKQIQEYKELFDVKVDLDRELAAYKAMLAGEEDRLSIKPSPNKRRPPPPDSPAAAKRSKSDPKVSSTFAGYIQVVDVDPNGRYIQISNTSDKAENVGTFRIVHTVDDTGATNVFNFHSRSRLKAGITTTVWASSAGVEHNPPTDIVSKQVVVWGTGEKTTTRLRTSKGDAIATYVQRKEEQGQSSGSQDTQ
uniref:Lamin A/C n=1 Tax=Halisarca dujardinii TaxID=2583056 RepID=A0AAU8KYD6_HALDU